MELQRNLISITYTSCKTHVSCITIKNHKSVNLEGENIYTEISIQYLHRKCSAFRNGQIKFTSINVRHTLHVKLILVVLETKQTSD